ncbi:MAG: PilT/PilU family type 4a pilus ATPase, partial [Planctomycetota bacterium]
LAAARRRGASDLHLAPGVPPVLRVNGALVRDDAPPLGAADVEALAAQLVDPDQRAHFLRCGDLDACREFGGLRYRLNLARTRAGCSVSVRLISERIPSLAELGIPPEAEELTKFAQGLVLITGPLGAGKTTTLFALVDRVNRSRPENIITIEDPVEFVLPPRRCQVAQRQRGRDTVGFGAALRGALREDPDIIVIGDLRDHETAGLAISAAETGHLVFASMATVNAMKTIDKLIDLFPASEQATTRTMLSESLRGILCQRLLPGTEGRRVAAVELVFNSIAVANIIREGNTAALLNAIQTGRSQGMRSFETSLQELLARGAITPETAAWARSA